MQKLLSFFDSAQKGMWVMSWQAWKTLVNHFCGVVVLDNDSGYDDADVVTAQQAERGFMVCTISTKSY